MLHGAISVPPALHAATAIRRATRAEGRGFALSVFVALVADEAVVVAAVCADRTICFHVTRGQTTVGNRIARGAIGAVCSEQAGDAAVSLIAVRKPGNLAVCICSALAAFTGNAVQLARARGMDTAGAPARGQASRTRSDTGSSCRRAACACQCPARAPEPIAASARGVEVEARIASLSPSDCKGCHSGRQEPMPALPRRASAVHGASANRLASFSANPRG